MEWKEREVEKRKVLPRKGWGGVAAAEGTGRRSKVEADYDVAQRLLDLQR